MEPAAYRGGGHPAPVIEFGSLRDLNAAFISYAVALPGLSAFCSVTSASGSSSSLRRPVFFTIYKKPGTYCLIMRRDTAPRSQSGILCSVSFALTQNSPKFQWFQRHDTGTASDGSTLLSGASGLTHICPEFRCFLRQNTDTTPHGNTFQFSFSILTQIFDEGDRK